MIKDLPHTLCRDVGVWNERSSDVSSPTWWNFEGLEYSIKSFVFFAAKKRVDTKPLQPTSQLDQKEALKST